MAGTICSAAEGAGLVLDVWDMLYTKEEPSPVGEITGSTVRIPHTIVYRMSVPVTWYFTSEADGCLRRRNRKNLTLDEIFRVFCKVHTDVKAVWIEQPAEQPQASFRYLNERQLRSFLYEEEDHKEGILQQYVPSAGLNTATVRVQWSPHVSFVERRTAICPFAYRKMSIEQRVTTFENTSLSTSEVIPQGCYLFDTATASSRGIVLRIQRLVWARQAEKLLQQYLKSPVYRLARKEERSQQAVSPRAPLSPETPKSASPPATSKPPSRAGDRSSRAGFLTQFRKGVRAVMGPTAQITRGRPIECEYVPVSPSKASHVAEMLRPSTPASQFARQVFAVDEDMGIPMPLQRVPIAQQLLSGSHSVNFTGFYFPELERVFERQARKLRGREIAAAAAAARSGRSSPVSSAAPTPVPPATTRDEAADALRHVRPALMEQIDTSSVDSSKDPFEDTDMPPMSVSPTKKVSTTTSRRGKSSPRTVDPAVLESGVSHKVTFAVFNFRRGEDGELYFLYCSNLHVTRKRHRSHGLSHLKSATTCEHCKQPVTKRKGVAHRCAQLERVLYDLYEDSNYLPPEEANKENTRDHPGIRRRPSKWLSPRDLRGGQADLDIPGDVEPGGFSWQSRRVFVLQPIPKVMDPLQLASPRFWTTGLSAKMDELRPIDPEVHPPQPPPSKAPALQQLAQRIFASPRGAPSSGVDAAQSLPSPVRHYSRGSSQQLKSQSLVEAHAAPPTKAPPKKPQRPPPAKFAAYAIPLTAVQPASNAAAKPPVHRRYKMPQSAQQPTSLAPPAVEPDVGSLSRESQSEQSSERCEVQAPAELLPSEKQPEPGSELQLDPQPQPEAQQQLE